MPGQGEPVDVPDATLHVGEEAYITLKIHNRTDHEVDPSLGILRYGVALVCSAGWNGDGPTDAPLASDQNFWFVTNPALGPGSDWRSGGGRDATRVMTDADIGTITCAGVIFRSPDGTWANNTLQIAGRITHIPPVSFQVVGIPVPQPG